VLIEYVQWAASATLLLLGAWVCIANWHAAYLAFVVKQYVPSWIPILGGLLLALGALLCPFPDVRRWFWLAFLIDFGCVIGVGHALLWHGWRYLWR
jgi:hypothetical protein